MGGIYLVRVSLLLFLRQTIGNGHFEWYVQQRVLQYGDNLTLLCVVRGCCTKKAGWGKWIPDFTTIFINVQDLDVSPNFKYDTHVDRNGFTLVIRQFDETDLNIPYSCTYGYDFSPKKVLTKALAFEDKADEERSKRGEGSSRAAHYLTVIVFPALAFCAIFGISVMLIKVCKSKEDQNRYNTREVTRQGNGSHRRERQLSLSRQTSGTSFNFYFNSSRKSPTASSSKCSIYFRAGSDLSNIDLYVDGTDDEEHTAKSSNVPIPCVIHKTDTGGSSPSKKNSTKETVV